MAANQLSTFDIVRSPETMMDKIVESLESYLADGNGFLLIRVGSTTYDEDCIVLAY